MLSIKEVTVWTIKSSGTYFSPSFRDCYNSVCVSVNVVKISFEPLPVFGVKRKNRVHVSLKSQFIPTLFYMYDICDKIHRYGDSNLENITF